MKAWLGALVWLMVVAAPACGEGTGGSDGTEPTGGSESGGSGSGQLEPGGGGSESSGGSGLAGNVTPPTSLPGLTCESREMVFEGTIQGQALSERLSLDGPYAGDWLLAGFPGGFVSLDVAEGSSADPREIAGGVLGFPTGSAREGEVWCVDPGSLMSSETRPDGALVGHLLGTCSGGTSLAGPLYLCYDGGDGYCDDDSADPSKRTLAGELGGQAVAPPVGGWGSLTGSVWIEHTDHFGVVLFAAEVANEAAPVDVAGYVIGQSGSPYEGEVYCISAGTWSQYSDDYVYQADQVVITEVTRLGSCSDGGAQDRLDVCIGY